MSTSSAQVRTRRSDLPKAAAFLAPGMAGFVTFIVLPLVASLVISFYNWPIYGDPEWVGMRNYKTMFTTDPLFKRVLFNTVVFAVLYTIANLGLAIALSVWLKSLGRWAGFFRVLFFIPVVTPMVANALVWKLLLADDGLINGLLGVVGIQGPSWLSSGPLAMGSLIVMSIWQGIGYNIIVLGAGLNGISESLLEAAKIDGASTWQRFTRVVLPMLSPVTFFCTVMTLIGAFKVFTQPFLLTLGGPGASTTTVVQYLYQNGFSYDRLGYASALAWVLFVIVMLFTALQFSQQKRFVNYDN